MTINSLVATRLFGCVLYANEHKAEVVARTFAPRLLGGEVLEVSGLAEVENHIQMGQLNSPLWSARDNEVLEVVDGVATINVVGSLMHKGAFLGDSSGVTSYEGLFRQVRAARTLPNVRGVVVELDSGGGEVAGLFDFCAELKALSKEKPTLAIVNDFAYSAAYMIAASCRAISISETGYTGSIGAIYMHQSLVRQADKMGVDVTIWRSASKKGLGHPLEELSDDFIADVQTEVERAGDLFASRVGEYRGKKLAKEKALATEGNSFGAEEALELGLVDTIARPSEAYAEFAELISNYQPRPMETSQ